MRYRRLPDWKMLNNVTNADRLIVRREQVEYADANRICERLETTGILFRARLRKSGRLYRGATTERCGFRVGGRCHVFLRSNSLSDPSTIINECCLFEIEKGARPRASL